MAFSISSCGSFSICGLISAKTMTGKMWSRPASSASSASSNAAWATGYAIPLPLSPLWSRTPTDSHRGNATRDSRLSEVFREQLRMSRPRRAHSPTPIGPPPVAHQRRHRCVRPRGADGMAGRKLGAELAGSAPLGLHRDFTITGIAAAYLACVHAKCQAVKEIQQAAVAGRLEPKGPSKAGAPPRSRRTHRAASGAASHRKERRREHAGHN